MPARHAHVSPGRAARPCRRCQLSEASIVVRSDPLCRDCFTKYVQTKVAKRMESYAYKVQNRIEGQERMLLLPVSFGVSSVTLLYMLDEHLRRQKEKTSRTGYALHILFVDTSAVERDCADAGRLQQLKERFPEYTYSCVALADVFDGSEPKDLLQDVPDASCVDVADAPGTPQERLEHLLISLPSATSRADVVSILQTRLVVRFAQQNGCEGILWGDSTTKIAEKTLAETAKGRGFSLPWQVADGTSPFGITFNYPLRDVLKKELIAYADLTLPPLTPLIAARPATQVSASAKNTTIDHLMKQYFESVEQEYPSIVANVVRTSSKLEAASTVDARCQLCGMPVTDGRFGIHGWGGDQNDTDASAYPAQGQLCYGCTRSAPQAAKLLP